jgi:putative oligomerization/nucleic acid binding protein
MLFTVSGTSEKIEAWIRAHPQFGKNARTATQTVNQAAQGPTFADELMKLASLRDQGVLSPEEFDRAKAKLLE